MMFNLDLSLIERRLSEEGLHVKPGLSIPSLTSRPLVRDTVFVMFFGDDALQADELTGVDVMQYTVENIAVIIGFKSTGDATGVQGSDKLKTMIDIVKRSLIGLIIDDFEPISYDRGSVLEVNRDTHNVLYQLQFKTAHTVVTEVKHHDQ